MREKKSREASSHAYGVVSASFFLSDTTPPRVCGFAAFLDRSAAPPARCRRGEFAFASKLLHQILNGRKDRVGPDLIALCRGMESIGHNIGRNSAVDQELIADIHI